LAGLTAAVLALLVIIAIAPVLSDLPRAVLSAIVVNAVWKLMDWGALRRYARVRRNDVMAAAIAATGVLAFGPLNGLLLAVAASVVGLVYRSSRVDVEVMGKVPHEKAAWGSVRNHDERPTYPGVLVLRVDAPMFWVTAAPIQDAVLARVDAVPGTRVLVLDLEATNQMDVTSADALAHLLKALHKRGIDLYLVRVMWPVRRALRTSGLMEQVGEDHLWHSISQGVREARHTHGLVDIPAGPGVHGVEPGAEPPRREIDEGATGRPADEPGDDLADEHIAARTPEPEPDPPSPRRRRT
jgi:anti-anti-sigma factor